MNVNPLHATGLRLLIRVATCVATRPAIWRTLLLFFGFLSLLPAQGTLAAQERAGEPAAATSKQLWFGTMNVENIRHFRFVVELEPQEDDWSGVLKSLDEGGAEFKLKEVTRNDSALTFQLPKTGAVYQGKLSDDGQSISGRWTQNADEFDLEFRSVASIPKRKVKAVWKGTINAVVQKLDVAFIELESGELLFDSISQRVGRIRGEG
jgi:hypothetical protein